MGDSCLFLGGKRACGCDHSEDEDHARSLRSGHTKCARAFCIFLLFLQGGSQTQAAHGQTEHAWVCRPVFRGLKSPESSFQRLSSLFCVIGRESARERGRGRVGGCAARSCGSPSAPGAGGLLAGKTRPRRGRSGRGRGRERKRGRTREGEDERDNFIRTHWRAAEGPRAFRTTPRCETRPIAPGSLRPLRQLRPAPRRVPARARFSRGSSTVHTRHTLSTLGSGHQPHRKSGTTSWM